MEGERNKGSYYSLNVSHQPICLTYILSCCMINQAQGLFLYIFTFALHNSKVDIQLVDNDKQ